MTPDRTASTQGTGRPAADRQHGHTGLWDVIRDLRRTQRDAPPIQVVPRDVAWPISFAQESLWYHYQLEPDRSLLNIFRAFSLSGPLNAKVLERSLKELIKRHEPLRTAIVADDGRPVQLVNEDFEFGLQVVDLRALAPSARDAEARRLAKAEATRPFDLSECPLFRAGLLRLEDEEYVLLLSTSHVVCDGWSLGVLDRELSAIYGAFSAEKAAPLADLPVQYVDFAAWQRTRLKGAFLKESLDYWKQKLKGTPALELPYDRPRPPVQSFRGSEQALELPGDLCGRLKALASQENATLFIVLLAAWKALLKRYSGQDDYAVGTLVAGRPRPELERSVGRFTNTLALRTDLSGDPTFRELLERVKETFLGAYAHQELPFEKLVEELRPERDAGRNAVFQTMFVLLNLPQYRQEKGLNLENVNAESVSVSQGHARFDLMCNLWPYGEGLKGSLEYATDLFDAETVERMARHYRTLLESAVAEPGRRVSGLPMLSDEERHRLLVQWNDTEGEYPNPDGRCVHGLFEEQAARTPDAVAIAQEGESLTYGELNAQADGLAHRLRGLGVGPEILVGLCAERASGVVGLLGILKAGGAYVPLDPDYPAERLSFMLSDSGAKVLVTQERLLARLPEDHDIETVLIDAEPHLSEAGECAASPRGPSVGGQLAYVIYTSGSTGRPKGVAIEHGSLVNHAVALSRHYEVGPSDRTLQFASFSFDVAAEEIFPTLLNGATLVLRPEHELLSHQDFTRFVDEQALTVLNLPAAYWHGWVRELAQSKTVLPSSLRLLVVGSDKVSPRALSLWQELADGEVRCVSAYGSTETTITSTTYEPLRVRGDGEFQSVPIGRPVANTRVYVLDDHLQPVPVGVPGDLYIGGVSVARHYLGRPALTAEKFVPDPFSSEPGSRMYHTGDLARYLSTGHLEFLGRDDQQVKIRGFRVELGEVEAALELHPAVLGALVMAQEERSGEEARLEAYVVLRQSEGTPAAADLRAFLKRRLPLYMVPSDFVEIEEFPIAPSGKVDRKALPKPGTNNLTPGESYVAPRSLLEEEVAKMWMDVLKAQRVGVRDNFFDMGGHSLSATQVISRVRQAFEIELPLRSIFEAPTVEGLAEYIEMLRWAAQVSSTPPGASGVDREEGQL